MYVTVSTTEARVRAERYDRFLVHAFFSKYSRPLVYLMYIFSVMFDVMRFILLIFTQCFKIFSPVDSTHWLCAIYSPIHICFCQSHIANNIEFSMRVCICYVSEPCHREYITLYVRSVCACPCVCCACQSCKICVGSAQRGPSVIYTFCLCGRRLVFVANIFWHRRQ